jgi:hypothetical protein
MKRPYLVHFLAIKTEENLHIRASVTMKENLITYAKKRPAAAIEKATEFVKEIEKEIPRPTFPIQAFRLLGSHEFKVKIVGLDKDQNEIYRKVFESDSYGNLNFKIPLNSHRQQINALLVYEIGKRPGLEIHLGNFIPIVIQDPKNIIICDFDKTLVDTKYSTTKEIYTSLTRPIDYFPTVTRSVEILKSYVDKNFHPFILSASPHFYEDAMRDWLYQNQIYTAGIFLKDYRKIFGLLDNALTPKDLKIQGMYKLNHLLDILIMTGIPEKLVLMGDNFESDPIIYLSLAKFLKQQIDPWDLWNSLCKLDAFQMNKKQKAQLLNKFYQLDNYLKSRPNENKREIELKIFIRKKVSGNIEEKVQVPQEFSQNMFLVESYDGLAPMPKLGKI